MGNDASTDISNQSKSKKRYRAETKTYKSGLASLRGENLKISEEKVSNGSETYCRSHKHPSHHEARSKEMFVPDPQERCGEKQVSSPSPKEYKIRTTKVSCDDGISLFIKPGMCKKSSSKEFSSISQSYNSESFDLKTLEYAKPSGQNLTTYERANFSAWESMLRNQTDHWPGTKTSKKCTKDNHEPIDRLDGRKATIISSWTKSTTPPKNSRTFEHDESGYLSNFTNVSELSVIDGYPSALSHSAARHESESDTTSFLKEALSDDSLLKHQCFTCGPYTDSSCGWSLPHPTDLKKPADRLDFTSNFFSGSGMLAVEPAKKQKSAFHTQNYELNLPSAPTERVIKMV